MTKTFELPDLGEGLHEAEIQEVAVSVGEEVKEGDVILLVETDKATVEIPSPYTGTIEEIKVQGGDVVQVGDAMMDFSVEGEEPEKEGAVGPEEKKEGKKAEAKQKEEKERAEKQVEEKKPRERAKKEARREGRPVPASPATRRLARELEVDLRQVPGSGAHGRVTAQDVRSYAEEGEAVEGAEQAERPEEAEKAREREARPQEVRAVETPELPDFGRWGEVERVELRSVRRTVAHRMAQSWAQIPHVSHRDMADITELERLRREEKEEVEAETLTLTAFVMKAAVAALKGYPRFNASLDMETEELILKRYYHLGVAVDTERGLIVPVVRNVDGKSIEELSAELEDLVERTRSGEVDLEALQGGTFTITNIGALGGVDFTPIINFPQAAILGVASASWQPVVMDEKAKKIEPRFILPLILTFDHRIVDGADAARFLSMVVDILEDPQKLLLKI